MTIPNDDEVEAGLVALGASQFSSPALHDNPSFTRSKDAFIVEAVASGISSQRVLDLFDKDFTVAGLVDQIDKFLRLNPLITDLIIYYCGHGGFTKRNKFYLALRSMREGREATEGLSLGQLRSDLDDRLSSRRVYLVLDCCFAAAVISEWMSDAGMAVAEVMADQVFESFPRVGTALLAAAPASAPAIAFENEEYTVFTSALVRVLHDGVSGQGPRLSMRDLFNSAEKLIKNERANTAPIPELYPRAQDHSDIAKTPLFLNAKGSKAPQEGEEKEEQEEDKYKDEYKGKYKDFEQEERVSSRSLAGLIEEIASRQGPLILSLEAMTVAFLLSLLSIFCGLGWLEVDFDLNQKKEVGFIFAPNWTIVYLVLFPLYLSVFSVLTSRCRRTLMDFCDGRILTGPNGAPISHQAILAAWDSALKGVSSVMWLVLALVVVQTVGQWIYASLVPLMTGKSDVVDWGTLAAVHPDKANWWATLFFASVAYIYMGVALFIYLAILIYAAAFAAFLNSLSDHSGQFRLVARSQIFRQRLSEIVTSTYVCVIFGIGAAIAMRMQAEYLQSGYTLITDLWFSDVIAAFRWLFGGAAVAQPAQVLHIPSKWTSFAELMVTLFILFIVVYLIYSAFDKARLFYLEHIDSADWRRRMKIQFDREEIERVRSWTFLNSVVPRHADMAVVLAGEVLNYIFIGYGSIGVAAAIYAVLKFAIAPTRNSRRAGGGRTGPVADVAGHEAAAAGIQTAHGEKHSP